MNTSIRAFYSEPVATFSAESKESILGKLALAHEFELSELQRNAWVEQIEILQESLADIDGHLLLEYVIPRVGKRIDAVLLSCGIVFGLEFKVGSSRYLRADLDQVHDYALDLKNFHEQSHDKPILPILVATEAPPAQPGFLPALDGVFAPITANKENLRQTIDAMVESSVYPEFDPLSWRDSRYRPTPTIVEAAQALYLGHSVREISRSDAGATNLTETSDAIGKIIDDVKARKARAICFVTGVPGAGKTLAGLNIANERLMTTERDHAVFLSGNGPLVKLLREALAKNAHTTSDGQRNRSLRAARTKAATFIQNIHHFRDAALRDDSPPIEKVVIFDEAQRAWTLAQTESFMKRKKGRLNFGMSEPEFLISVMDRHPDWTVIICLIGGGQEINTGEAGLTAWFDALRERFSHWEVYISNQLEGVEYFGDTQLSEYVDTKRVIHVPALHLAVSIRSFRSEKVADFVRSLLEGELDRCRQLYHEMALNFPIVLTRDLSEARDWLRKKGRGSERYGVLASSGGIRLRPIGIDVKAASDVVNWFLGSKDDVRSSFYLEMVATEFDVQGLEVDWAAVVWDADLRSSLTGWEYWNFRGSKWQKVRDRSRQQYLKNAYRVLLTRARQGMVIVLPQGDQEDWTREPGFYDSTYEYLLRAGIQTLDSMT